MTDTKIYQQIAKDFCALLRCEKIITTSNDTIDIENKQKWVDTYTDGIDKIVKEEMPHGSGIDNGIHFDYENSKPNKLVFNSSFHCMDENGYYDGWIDFRIVITPCLELEYHVKIVGNFGGKYNHIKNYLHDIFDHAFNQIFTKG